MTLQGAQEVLRLLTEAYPPPGKKSHSLELSGGELVLLLWHEGVRKAGLVGGRWPLSFSPGELELDPAQVVDEVRRALGRLGYSESEAE